MRRDRSRRLGAGGSRLGRSCETLRRLPLVVKESTGPLADPPVSSARTRGWVQRQGAETRERAIRSPGRPGKIRLLADLAARGGVALVRTPGQAGAGALLQSIDPDIYAITQPVGLDPELSPWPLVAGSLALLDGPDLSRRDRERLLRFGRRSAEAIESEFIEGDPLDEGAAVELLLSLLARRRIIVAVHRLDRAQPGAVRIAELLTVELGGRGALLLGSRDGAIAEQLEAAVGAAGGLIIRLTPADIDDALTLVESELAALDLTSASELTERLLGRFEEIPDPGREAEVCARLARMFRDAGAPQEEWRRLVRRGLRAAGLSGSERSATLLGLLVERTSSIPGAIPASLRLRPPASLVAMARRRADPVLLAELLDPYLHLSRDETDTLIAEAEGWGEPSARLHAFEIAGRMLLYAHGELEPAAALFRRIEEEATHHGLPWLRATALAQQATCRLAAGSLDDAMAIMEVARETIAQLGSGTRLRGIASVAFAGSIAMVRGGDLRALRDRAAEAIRSPGAGVGPLPSIAAAYDAWFALASGERDGARDRLRSLIPIVLAQGPDGYVMNGIAGIGAQVAAALGDLRDLASFTATIEGLIERRIGPYPVTSPAIALADLRSLTEPVRALDELAAAAAAARERGFLTAALLAESRAELLRVQLEPDATERLTVFIARAELVGFDTSEHRRLAGSAAPPPSTHAAGGLSEREREVLGLVAAGATTAEIASRLFLSPHTVTRHLANTYGKLGVRNRAEATAWAIRTGLLEQRPGAPKG